ncbi:hypothetical protein SAY87_028930 [Trapa incisa]|uniref:Peptidase A1 domain-containing protein n=1 Tax=Trapa incisa TaxID=236973 RepID=A0AAN7QQJ8_9MYRT|nr:hypothetical protein SAY87_028930 [Trapa incisa]
MVTQSPVNVFLFMVFLELVALSSGEFLKHPLLQRTPRPSPSEALSQDIRRLNSLLRRPPAITSPIISGASSGTGQYFVTLHLGSPPQRLNLVADTGSDLIWAKCSACTNCSAHYRRSYFLVRHSSSFRSHHCYSDACRLVPHSHDDRVCNLTRLHSSCRYEYSYSDGSVSAGFFASETATLNTSFNRVVELRNLDFGCGFQVAGPSVTGASFHGAQGVLGLGRGDISFSSQLGRHFGNKFSYCLMDYTLSPSPTSFLTIGGDENATVLPSAYVSFTPLLTNPISPTFYYISIQTISVGGERLPVSPSVWSLDEIGNGGTIIDSGTTLTFLAKPAHAQVLAAMRKRVRLPSTAVLTPGFDLCVNVTGLGRKSVMAALPKLTLRLRGGAVMVPPPRNYFIPTAEGVRCLAILAVTAEGSSSVIGNLMQQGFLFEFDRDRSRLGFSRHGCSLSL